MRLYCPRGLDARPTIRNPGTGEQQDREEHGLHPRPENALRSGRRPAYWLQALAQGSISPRPPSTLLSNASFSSPKITCPQKKISKPRTEKRSHGHEHYPPPGHTFATEEDTLLKSRSRETHLRVDLAQSIREFLSQIRLRLSFLQGEELLFSVGDPCRA